jgi:hypothetical protein
MNTAVSADGTVIAFDRSGDGPPVIMTGAAFNTRSATEPLARALAPRFTVLNYDRRGRGDSSDTAPYAVEREIDDIAALGGLAVGGLAEPRHGPAGGRPACQRLPDAAARAGDQRDPSAEWSVHDCGPVTPDGRSPWRVAAGRHRR